MWVCQIQSWFQWDYQNLKSSSRLHTGQGKKNNQRANPPNYWVLKKKKKRKKSDLLTFTSFFLGRKKKKKRTIYVKHHIPIHQSGHTALPRTQANLPSPFFHTWLMSLDYCGSCKFTLAFTLSLVACPLLLPHYFRALTTLPFYPRWERESSAIPQGICV